MTAEDNIRKYGDPRSLAEIKRLPRAEMIATAKACCLLEHMSDDEIAAATVAKLRREIDAVDMWMSNWNRGDY